MSVVNSFDRAYPPQAPSSRACALAPAGNTLAAETAVRARRSAILNMATSPVKVPRFTVPENVYAVLCLTFPGGLERPPSPVTDPPIRARATTGDRGRGDLAAVQTNMRRVR